MPNSNTLSFSAVTDISFQSSASEIKILVNGTLLGTINKNKAVSVYITDSGSTKTITWTEISDNIYNNGNAGNLSSDTIAYDYANLQANLHIDCCSGASNKYKIIGWEDETIGQSCTGSAGSSNFFDITTALNFKSRIEQVTDQGVTEWKMVVRYSSAVMTKETASTALCYTGLYCYYCN